MYLRKPPQKIQLIAIFAVILFGAGCESEDLEDQSLVTGQCELTSVRAILEPNPVTLTAGQSAQIEVTFVVSSNCIGFAKAGYLTDPEIPYQMPPTSVICGTSIENNVGYDNFTLNTYESKPPGVYYKRYKVHASSDHNYGGNKITDFDTLEIHIEAPPTGDFDLYPPPSLQVFEGIAVQPINIEIWRENDHDEEINLSITGLPPFTFASFDPDPVPGNVLSTNFTIFADYDATPGSYELTMTANDGTTEKNYFIDFLIRDQYTLMLSQDTVSMAAGQSGSVTVDIDWGHSEVYNEMIFEAIGTIIGTGTNLIEAEFNPNPAPWGTFSTVLSLMAGQDVGTGYYEITITGANENLEKEVALTISIEDTQTK